MRPMHLNHYSKSTPSSRPTAITTTNNNNNNNNNNKIHVLTNTESVQRLSKK